jgi:mRNA-decapping enzyme subunit 2
MINPESVIEMEIREQQISLFVVPGIPEDFHFETKTRKEISKIEWFRLVDLPTWKRNKAVPGKFYLISPFIGPLKAFINEHKPRKPSRRTQRPKDIRPKHEFPDESDASAIEFQSCPPTHLDATAQESSSQTSSADNGDPQTPSPLYSEAVVTHVDVAQTTESNGLNSTAVDPHFARLLSALTQSATTNGNDDGKLDCIPPASAAIHPSSVSPVADATLNGGPRTREVLISNAVGDSATMTHTRHPSKPFKPSSATVPINDTYRLSNPSSGPRVSSPLPSSQSTVTPGLVTSQSPTSKSPSHSRRSSMITADLSPYLARPAGIPMNGKQLKQLALLEAIADESSRMTLAPAVQSSSPHGASPALIHALPPSNTVVSHNFTNLSPMYSNTHGPYLPIPQTGPLNPPSPNNGLAVRPRSSNSFRPVPNYPPRPFNTRGSMNQAQLVSAVSGTSYPYAPTPSLHRSPIPPMPNLNFHSPSTYPPPPVATVVTGAPTFRTGPYPPAIGRVPPPPLPVLSSQAISGPTVTQGLLPTPGGSSNFLFSRSTANSQNSQLLSILNRGSGQ